MQQQCPESEERARIQEIWGHQDSPLCLLLPAALFHPAKQQLWSLLSTELAGKKIQELPDCEGKVFKVLLRCFMDSLTDGDNMETVF